MYNKSQIFKMIQSLCTSIWINCTVYLHIVLCHGTSQLRLIAVIATAIIYSTYWICSIVVLYRMMRNIVDSVFRSLQDDEEYGGICFQIFLIIIFFNKTSLLLFLIDFTIHFQQCWSFAKLSMTFFLATKCISCLETDVKAYWRIFFFPFTSSSSSLIPRDSVVVNFT